LKQRAWYNHEDNSGNQILSPVKDRLLLFGKFAVMCRLQSVWSVYPAVRFLNYMHNGSEAFFMIQRGCFCWNRRASHII